MTLFEFALINSLIESNYRRRIKNFWINLFFILIPAVLLFILKTEIVHYHLLCLFVGICASVRFIFVYADDGLGIRLPWVIYKKQKDAICTARKNEQSFEELDSYPILSDFF